MSVGRTHISRTRGGQKTVGRPPFLRTVQNYGRDLVKTRGAGAADAMMRASTMHEYGEPNVLKLETLPLPKESAKYPILVKVAFTTVNPADAKQRSGNLKLVVKHNFPVSFGQDFSGVVESSLCPRFKAGDHVYGCTAPRNGCGAEYVCVAEKECTHKPAALPWAVAAASPTSVCTAFRGVVSIGGAAAGQKILVHGASGGVGAAMVQIAVALQCEVWGTCSSRNNEYLRSLGAKPLDYSNLAEELAAAGFSGGSKPATDPGVQFDLVLDAVGGDDIYSLSLPLLAPHGRYVSAVGPVRMGGSEPITIGTILWSMRTLIPRLLISALWPRRKYCLYLAFSVTDLTDATLKSLIEAGKVKPRIDPQPFDLGSLAEAHSKCETHHSSGRIAIQVAPP